MTAASARADAVLDALGDPMRRRIAEALRDGPRPVGLLAERLPIGRPAVSKHLAVLEGAGVVTHTAVGTRNLYALAPEGLAPLQVWLTETWDAALAAFAAHLEEES
ncbi:MAG: winged helix-turn-helix transcriptional regulator [Actinomycetales bacterium]|nr:winged helix-turn-helix transcriptional regulator [Actinomycetales bacterium]